MLNSRYEFGILWAFGRIFATSRFVQHLCFSGGDEGVMLLLFNFFQIQMKMNDFQLAKVNLSVHYGNRCVSILACVRVSASERLKIKFSRCQSIATI